jgi:hypothetical protein
MQRLHQWCFCKSKLWMRNLCWCITLQHTALSSMGMQQTHRLASSPCVTPTITPNGPSSRILPMLPPSRPRFSTLPAGILSRMRYQNNYHICKCPPIESRRKIILILNFQIYCISRLPLFFFSNPATFDVCFVDNLE